ncbi:stromal interaction molecule 1-like [Liolophura sinensis]|uniref:stromal interaction molecule 1-like n=1 Tax=Liolophura sinensis TaxID=3198878 RepID=UPI003158D256
MVKTERVIMWRITLYGRTSKAAKCPAGVLLMFSVVLLLSGRTLCQRPTHTSNRNSIESSKPQSQAIIQVPSSDESQHLLRTGEIINYKSAGSGRNRPDENKLRRVPRVGIDRVCSKHDFECTKDKISMDAIIMLHSLLDDDRNGNVDQSESDEFLRDELQYTDGFERNMLFHGGDKLISVDDLWRTWKLSSVYNWTVDDVVDWLVYHVELPQYVDIFRLNIVDGTQLPRLATNTHHYISGVLGIKNPVHKQKLSVKAMDVVLFGPPKKAHSYIKDVAVVASLVIALGGCWFAYAQHKYSQNNVKRMMKDMESLQKAEESLIEMQNKLEKAEQEQLSVSREKKNLEEKYRDEIEAAKAEAERLKNAREGSLEEMSRLKLAEEELKQVRSALKRAEKEIESREAGAPSELQPYLQLTHEIELMHYHAKRHAAERQLISAREECERIRKKRNTVMGAMRMAHSNSMDEIDQRIANARAALEEVRITLQERLHRWGFL